LSFLEADFKRIVHDARTLAGKGDTKSSWHRDAERLRKTASNWMRSYNPAYNNPQYDCKPTPRPPESSRPAEAPRRSNRAAASTRHSTTPAEAAASEDDEAEIEDEDEEEDEEDGDDGDDDDDAMDVDLDFTGKSFQEAQELLIESMINYRDEK
jgi:hypothetical protein